MKLQLFFILLAIPFWSFAQKQDAPEREFRVEIYSDQFSHENLWWQQTALPSGHDTTGPSHLPAACGLTFKT